MEKTDQTMVVPLESLVYSARACLHDTVSAILNETKLPLYIVDGIMSEELAEIRRKELNNRISKEKGETNG